MFLSWVCVDPDFFFFLHLWLLLHWVCALNSMAVCGVSEQVNGLLTPHRWLAWLIRQPSAPRFPSYPLSFCSLALYSCQMVSMQSWEQRKIKGRLQRLENQEGSAVISCCSHDTFTGFVHSVENNLKRECKWLLTTRPKAQLSVGLYRRIYRDTGKYATASCLSAVFVRLICEVDPDLLLLVREDRFLTMMNPLMIISI